MCRLTFGLISSTVLSMEIVHESTRVLVSEDGMPKKQHFDGYSKPKSGSILSYSIYIQIPLI